MKSLTAVCQTGASMPAIKTNGRVTRHPRHRADGENAEMKMYLSKLKDLVPFMPKRKLSKLEIIQHVIDYICDLQTELESHPDIGNFDAATALSFANVNANNINTDDEQYNSNHSDEDMLTPTERLAIEAMQQQQLQFLQQQHQSSPANATAAASASATTTNIRQPLVDRQTPNTILPPTTASAAATALALATTITTTTTATPTPLMSLQIQSQAHQQHFQTATTAQTPSVEKDSRQQPC